MAVMERRVENGIDGADRIVDLVRHHANDFFISLFLTGQYLLSQFLNQDELTIKTAIEKFGVDAMLDKMETIFMQAARHG